MAQINEAVLDEIRKYINDNPDGINREDLYAKCTTASDDVEIANCLRYLVGLVEIYKVGDIYKSVIVDSLKARHIDKIQTQAAVEEKKQSENSEPIAAKPDSADTAKMEANEVPPADPIEDDPSENDQPTTMQASRKYGTLARNAISGQVAMYFYHHRDSQMTIADVVKNLVLAKDGNVAVVIYGLVAKKYLVRPLSSTRQNKLYQWSGEFIYPFRKVKPEDLSLISLRNAQVDPIEEVSDAAVSANNDNQATLVTVNDSLHPRDTSPPQHSLGSESTHSDESHQLEEAVLPYDVLLNTYMSTIDASIKHHESQIEYLKIMRNIAQRTYKAPMP